MSALLYDGLVDLNDQTEQHFVLSDGTHSRFIITDILFSRNGQTVFNARQPSITSTSQYPTPQTHYLILSDPNNGTMWELDSNDKYISISKGDFTQPDKFIIGPDIYVMFADVEGMDCDCKMQVWGYGIN